MLATKSFASGIAGQLSAAETAWFTFAKEFAADLAPNGFNRALVALAADTATVDDSRSHTSRTGTGDAPYEHR